MQRVNTATVSLGRDLGLMLIIAVAYGLTGHLGLLLAIPPGYATAVWPPSGIALAALLLCGNRAWPGIWLGSFLINVWTQLDVSSATAMIGSMMLPAVIALGAAGQAILGAKLIRRFVGYHNILEQEIDVVRMLALGGPIACLTAASIGVGGLWMTGAITSDVFLFNWWTWWVGDSIGVLIFTPAILVWAVRPFNIWLRRQLAVTLPLMLLFALVVLVFISTSAREQNSVQAEFETVSDEAALHLQTDLDRYEVALSATAGLFSISQEVTAAEFNNFTGMLLRQLPGLFAISWNEVVAESERQAFEARMHEQGFGDFRIVDQNPLGDLVPSASRETHVVVTYILYSGAAKGAQGLDVEFDPARRAANLKAAQTRQPTATEPVRLVGDVVDSQGLLLNLPVHDKNDRLRGYVTLVIRHRNLVERMLRDMAGAGIELRVTDQSASPPQLMYGSNAAGTNGDLNYAVPIEVGQRLWNLQYTLPASYLVAHRSWEAWLVLAAGMFLTALLGILLLVLVGRAAKIEGHVGERTLQLRASEERFRGLVESAPDAMVIVGASGRIALINSQTEKLFGYSRQELVGQSVESLIPERFRGDHVARRDGYIEAPRARAMGEGRALYGRRKDGSEFPLEISLSPLRVGDEVIITSAIRDITQQRAAEAALKASEARYRAAEQTQRAIVAGVIDAIVTIDDCGIVQSFNPAAERMFGWLANEMIGCDIRLLMPAQHRVRVDFDKLEDGDLIGLRRESTGLRRDGSQFPIELALNRMPHPDRREYVAMVSDISERKSAEAHIQHLAHHDTLTKLPNRALLQDRLNMAIVTAERQQRMLAVMMLDLDHFKRINDSLGHHVGDQLLLTVADRLRDCVRKSDTVARMGGDEFVVLLTDVTQRSDVERIADTIVRQLSLSMTLGKHELVLTPSIGVCSYPDDGRDSLTLLKNADTAMYQAKEHGRGHHQWFSQDMLRAPEEHLELTNALHRALEREEFSLHYQPLVSIHDCKVIGVEALLRWTHPTRGSLAPSSFVFLAEESGVIAPIGEWVLRKACRDIRLLQQQLGQPLTLAVNVSPRQFKQHNIVAVVRKVLADSGLAPEHLTLEITESLLLENREDTVATLKQLRSLGVRIAVDDFGTGYSSLSYLTRFPIDKLKIDGSFVRDLSEDSDDAAVVSAIIAMGKSLRMMVVAEGVETLDQLQYLRERGCDEIQGFFLSKAVTLEQFPAVAQDIQSRLAVLPLFSAPARGAPLRRA